MSTMILLACSTCRVTMLEAGGDAAGWSIFFLLVVILAMLGGVVFFMFRIARRERENFDPSLSDDYSPSEPSN
jgi:cbb3-type cytochrome oxidase subunit 3